MNTRPLIAAVAAALLLGGSGRLLAQPSTSGTTPPPPPRHGILGFRRPHTAVGSSVPISGGIVGNKRTHVYHLPGDTGNLPAATLFEPGKAILTDAGRAKLDELAPWFEQLKIKGSDVVVVTYADPKVEKSPRAAVQPRTRGREQPRGRSCSRSSNASRPARLPRLAPSAAARSGCTASATPTRRRSPSPRRPRPSRQ